MTYQQMLLTAGPLGDIVPLRTARMLELGHVTLVEIVTKNHFASPVILTKSCQTCGTCRTCGRRFSEHKSKSQMKVVHVFLGPSAAEAKTFSTCYFAVARHWDNQKLSFMPETQSFQVAYVASSETHKKVKC